MPYRTISSGQFMPAGSDTHTHLNILPGKGCILIEPFLGDISRLYYLIKTYSNHSICIPKHILKLSGVQDKAYVEVSGDTTYILGESFAGSFADAVPFPFPSFHRMPQPGEDFFKEAQAIHLESRTFKKSKTCLYIPAPIARMAGLSQNTDIAAISLFSDGDARWTEIRPQIDDAPDWGQRFNADYYIPSLSGITFNIQMPEIDRILLRPALFSEWKKDSVFCWYSETRKAIILEDLSKTCAACGRQMRSTERFQPVLTSCSSCYHGLLHHTV